MVDIILENWKCIVIVKIYIFSIVFDNVWIGCLYILFFLIEYIYLVNFFGILKIFIYMYVCYICFYIV